MQSVEDEMFRLPKHISSILLNDIDNDDDHSDKDKNCYDDNDGKLYVKSLILARNSSMDVVFLHITLQWLNKLLKIELAQHLKHFLVC